MQICIHLLNWELSIYVSEHYMTNEISCDFQMVYCDSLCRQANAQLQRYNSYSNQLYKCTWEDSMIDC